MKPKTNSVRVKSTRTKPLDEQQKKALEMFYTKVSEEAVKKTLKDIEQRQRRAAVARRLVLK